MKHLFVPYELALLAKGKGFNEKCLSFYNLDDNVNLFWEDEGSILGPEYGPFVNFDSFPLYDTKIVTTPLYQQLVDWFREQKDIQINITWNKHYPNTPYEYLIRPTWKEQLSIPYGTGGFGKNYYKALNNALTEAFKLI